MTARLRRILVTAFLGALVGVGVITALFGRRKSPRLRSRAASEAEVGALVAATPSAKQTTNGGRGLALGVVCLALVLGLVGVVYESRDTLVGLGQQATGGGETPMAALSFPKGGGDRPSALPTADALREAGRTPERDGRAVPPPPGPPSPSFDVVRVEPSGEAVLAGRAAPNATVDLLVDGRTVASVRADGGGAFTVTPPPLPTGTSEIALRATDAQGETQHSSSHVAVLVAPSRNAKPFVALTSPDAPTLVLSRPDSAIADNSAPASEQGRTADRDAGDDLAKQGLAASQPGASIPAAGSHRSEVGRAEPSKAPDPAAASRSANTPVADATMAAPKVLSIDAQDGGKLVVNGRAAPGASIRLYLNDSLVAPATVGPDGTVAFTIGQGVKAGQYRVRLDLLDPATGKVRDRAEVSFTAPGSGHDEGVEYSAARQSAAPRDAVPTEGLTGNTIMPRAPLEDPAQPAKTGGLAANAPPGAERGTGAVYVPGIVTTRIVRGDNLWTISRRIYGEGERYTLIYDANQEQIRDPNLIYPDQVFVLPSPSVPVEDKQ